MFENEYYTEGGKSPKYKGKLTINGVDKEFAVWPKENNGKTFFSGKISEPFVKQEKPQMQDPLKKKIEAKHDDMQEDYGDLPFN
jgi:hypothetical protein